MIKELPLAGFHKNNGAIFGERDGWLLPLHFGNTGAEHAAVRLTLGLMDQSYRAVLEFTGPDRLSYLQGMISNDLRTLESGRGFYATLLNQQGKVLADCDVLGTENSYLMVVWEALKDKIVEHLNRYLVADEVEIQDRSAEYGWISAEGPNAGQFLELLTGNTPVLPRDPLSHAIQQINGAEIRFVRYSQTGEDGFVTLIRRPDLLNLATRFAELGQSLSGKWVGEEAAEILRLEAGIPRYGVDFSEDYLVLETGMDHAVNFKKGCYLGQEVVERIRSRGHVNKRLVGLLFDGQEPAERLAKVVVSGKEVGAVTSSVFSPTVERAIAFAYVHKDHWAPGTTVSVLHNNGKSLAARVTALPFFRRAG